MKYKMVGNPTKDFILGIFAAKFAIIKEDGSESGPVSLMYTYGTGAGIFGPGEVKKLLDEHIEKEVAAFEKELKEKNRRIRRFCG